MYFLRGIVILKPLCSQHKSTPYCHIPCYSALFGPKLFGHGSRVESHRNFGRRENSFVREQKSLERSVRDGFNSQVELISINRISSNLRGFAKKKLAQMGFKPIQT